MAEYINRETLIKAIDESGKKYGITSANICNFKEIVQTLPAVDVVEVVRCKDCAKYIEMEGYDYNGRKARCCIWLGRLRRENDYCNNGIRKEKK